MLDPRILIRVMVLPSEAREQDSPEAVAHGMAEATLEGLDVELAEGISQGLADANDSTGQFEATPTNTHRNLSPDPKRRLTRTRPSSAAQQLDDQLGRDGQADVLIVGRRETRPRAVRCWSGPAIPGPAGSSRSPGSRRRACGNAHGS